MTSDFTNNSPIAVVGSQSMVGSRFCEMAKSKIKLVKGDLNDQTKIDICERKSVTAFFKNHNFQWLILFSAFTDVNGAEKQRGDKNGPCWHINVEGCQNIANACRDFSKKLIFISTDFVFDGTAGPYAEDAPIGPNLDKVSWYGITKIEGESIVKRLEEFIILRISYPYRAKFEQKEDFARSILRKYRKNTLYPMFTDQIITPTFVDDLAPAISKLIKEDKRGIFHLASPRQTTPYDFAKYLIRTFFTKTPKIGKTKLAELLKRKNTTPRPIMGGMIVDKIAKTGFTPTDWEKGIKKTYTQSKGKLI